MSYQRNRDSYLSHDEVVHLLQEAWDARLVGVVSFTLTEQDVELMTEHASAQHILETFNVLKTILLREKETKGIEDFSEYSVMGILCRFLCKLAKIEPEKLSELRNVVHTEHFAPEAEDDATVWELAMANMDSVPDRRSR